jgi:predicted deacetylase
MGKYLIRFDDIAPNMDWKKFDRFINVAIKNNINPILAVIPDNKDSLLLKYPGKENLEFWNIIRNLDSIGWEIAMHGLNHKYLTIESGIMEINNDSEFAGLSLDYQKNKLNKSLTVFNHNSINPRVFVAPAHSFDLNTLIALKEIGINIVSDGYRLFPYNYQDLVFVPQLFSKPRKLPFGVFTFCVHLNNITEDRFTQLIDFIEKNKKDFINIDEALQMIDDSIIFKRIEFFFKYSLSFIRSIRKKC